MRSFSWFKTISVRLGIATSAAILAVSMAFSGYRYVSETALLTDQLHAHMGENVAALMACIGRMQTAAAIQTSLEEFLAAVDSHVHEYEHEPNGRHMVLVLDANGGVLASADRSWIGRTIPEELRWLSRPRAPSAADKFRTLTLEGSQFLSLSERLGGGRRILYLEPYASVTRLARGSLVRNLVFSLLLAASLAGVVHVLVRRLVIRRLELLAQAMERVERDGLESPIPSLGTDELGAVRDVYARTITELGRSRQVIEQHARTLETEVEERTAQLLRAHRLAAVGELAAGLAHGLNNPLASVAASAEKLDDLLGRDPEQLQLRMPEHLRRILRNTDRCKHIAQSLLSFARESRFSPRPIHLEPILHEAAAVLEAEAEARGVDLRIAAEKGIPPLVADSEAVTQVLVNLLANALDASAAGSSVELSAALQEAGILVAVTDHGAGIDPEDLEQIFRPFFTTKPPGSGTGLGLSICHGIVEQLGGSIAVISQLGKGSRFEVHLPLLQPPVNGGLR